MSASACDLNKGKNSAPCDSRSGGANERIATSPRSIAPINSTVLKICGSVHDVTGKFSLILD